MNPKSKPRQGTFGPFAQAPNNQVMSNYSNYFVTEDATPTSPVTSPIASLPAHGTSVLTIVVPGAAVRLWIYASAGVRVSEDANQDHYVVVPATDWTSFPCVSPETGLTTTGDLYISGDSSTPTVQFYFECV